MVASFFAVVAVFTTSAAALPAPDRGPVGGGTQVSVELLGVTSFETITAGGTHTVAIGSDGNTYAWGANRSGQLGNGTTTDSTIPMLVSAPAGVSFEAITAGRTHTVAIGSDGNTYAWGENEYGQLGNGTTTDSTIPMLVSTPTGVSFETITAGGYHTVAIGSDGNTYAWGDSSFGQLGNGSIATLNETPMLVSAPAGVSFETITAGGTHTVAIGSDGNTYAWGENEYGQLGNGSIAFVNPIPMLVSAPAGVSFETITAGGTHTVAIGSDGNTYAWGENEYGQLGNGTTTDSTIPMLVSAPAGVSFETITAGRTHTVAIGSDGNTYAWGENEYGQLGNGSIATLNETPMLVSAPAGVSFEAITAGGTHTVAIGSDGNTYAWGENEYGQLGNGTTTDSTIPMLVSTPAAEVTEIAFDGLPGTSLTEHADRTWSILTPEHVAGVVDVVVSWTISGVPQTPITYSGGFTYERLSVAPTITNPGNQSVIAGKKATFSVVVTGEPDPAVTWEYSTNAGITWSSIAGHPRITLSADALTLTVISTQSDTGNQYRASATNSAGTTTSDSATLTVTPNNGGGNTEDALPNTGSDHGPLALIALSLLAVGAVGLIGRRFSKQRN